jgi:parallel beta-helix repeat protein
MAVCATWRRCASLSVAAVVLGLSAACSSKPDRDPSDPLPPGPLAEAELQLRLIEATPGTVINLAAGRFEFTRGLSLGANRVTIRGAGPDATFLSFSGQTEPGEGLLVTGDDVRLEGFAVVDTRGDGIKSKGADRIIYRNLRVAWSGAPKTTNGAYGVNPVESKDVLIDGVTVRGASEAGIHVGQSRQVIVRNSRAEFNVAGIEIGNSSNVDVFGNVVTSNTAGILVFNLPDLPVKEGRDIRVFDNQVFSNNTPNFAPPGNIVASVPAGTGIMVMAARGVHVFRNQLSMNQSVHLLIAAHFLPLKDPYFDPLPADILVRDNKFGVGGDSPQGMLKPLAAALGSRLPPIVWDGVTTHRLTTKPPTIAILEPKNVGFLDLRLARTPVDFTTADPAPQRPPAVRVVEPETVVVPQDPL